MIRLSTETDATFAPYSNNCPISGRTAAVVDDVGKNLADVSNAEIGTAWNGDSNTARARLIIPCKSNTTYTISINGVNNLDLIYMYDSPVVPASHPGDSIITAKTFTTGSSSRYIIVGFNKTNISQADINVLKLQLEEDSTPTPYEPYTHSSATIQLGQTVYGGTVNLVTGSATVTHKLVTLNGTESIGWWLSTSGDMQVVFQNFATFYSDVKTTGGYQQTVLFNEMKTAKSSAERSAGCAYLDNGYINTCWPLGTFADSAAFNTWLTSNNLQIRYELAEPIELTITPTEVQMLKGYNRVTLSDGYGTIELKALTGANWS
jgi:hypothetical protein